MIYFLSGVIFFTGISIFGYIQYKKNKTRNEIRQVIGKYMILEDNESSRDSLQHFQQFHESPDKTQMDL